MAADKSAFNAALTARDLKGYADLVGVPLASFSGADALVLQVIALSGKKHGMAYGLMLRRLRKTRSNDVAGMCATISDFLKQNGLGVGALTAAMRRLPLADRNALIRRIAAVLVNHGFPFAKFGLEGNLIRLTVKVITEMSDNTRSFMVRTLNALDVVRVYG